ncbi:MAG: Rpn family recombination-promoting nuclease/putative transposase [Planctomycetes bacterium]|nr:Rpn family recombination-promoting nuclease/putative transposase [Planctomycetota bacterium]
MQSGIDPKVDYAFKRLFGSEAYVALLVDLLNAVLSLPLGKRVREVALRNPFSDKAYAEDKASILDVRASDESGRQHHLEMQLAVGWAFPKRFLFYWAQHHAGQLREGDFYQTLCATYSIAFLNGRLLEDDHYHHTFRVWDARRGTELCKDLEMHTIELPKFNLTAEQCSTPLERWCSFLKHGATLDDENLPPSLDVPPIRQALEILRMLSQDELERERYLDRLKAERDAASLQHGYRLARESGLEEGREEGELIGRIHLCQRMLKQPLTPKEELLRQPIEELYRLSEQLEAQLLPKQNGAE